MRSSLLLAAILLASSLLEPLAAADPATPTAEDAQAAVATAASTANHAYVAAVPLALGAYAQGMGAATRAYELSMTNGMNAYATAIPWGISTYAAAVDTANGDYSAIVAHATTGYANTLQTAGNAQSAADATSRATYGSSVNSTNALYKYGAAAGLGSYAAASYLTEDAYAFAVEHTLIVYPKGVATFGELARDLGIPTSVAYSLVFNPIALLNYLQGYDELGGTLTVRAPTVQDALLQTARHPLSVTNSGPLAAEPPHARIDAPSVTPTPVAGCDQASGAFTSGTAWSDDHPLEAWNAPIGEEVVLNGRSLQVTARPFGPGCPGEATVYVTNYYAKGVAHLKSTAPVSEAVKLFFNMTGSSFDGRSPLNNRPIREQYGYGHAAPTAAASLGLDNPVLFAENADGITFHASDIALVSIAGEDVPENDCRVMCEILDMAVDLASSLAEFLGPDFAGIVHSAGRATVSTVAYLAENYGAVDSQNGVPGAGIRFDSDVASAADRTKDILVAVPYTLDRTGLVSTHVTVRTSAWGYWIEKAWRPTLGEDCVSDDACDWMSETEATSMTILLFTAIP